MWRQYETGVLLWKVWPERATLSLRTDVLLIKVLRGPACWSPPPAPLLVVPRRTLASWGLKCAGWPLNKRWVTVTRLSVHGGFSSYWSLLEQTCFYPHRHAPFSHFHLFLMILTMWLKWHFPDETQVCYKRITAIWHTHRPSTCTSSFKHGFGRTEENARPNPTGAQEHEEESACSDSWSAETIYLLNCICASRVSQKPFKEFARKHHEGRRGAQITNWAHDLSITWLPALGRSSSIWWKWPAPIISEWWCQKRVN